MEPPWPISDPIAPVCCPPFDEMYGFRAIDASIPPSRHYRTCWVGFRDATNISGGDEAFWGLLCGWGCNAHCSDTALTSMIDWDDGRRWIQPIPSQGVHARDGHGMRHDLRSSEHHIVPDRMQYIRGTCFKNDGEECFGTDVCGCWGENKAVNRAPRIGGVCEDGTPIYGEMSDHRTDEFFYSGYGWPPTTTEGRHIVQGDQSAYCRKFQDGRDEGPPSVNKPNRIRVNAPKLGGLVNKAEYLLGPICLSSSTCNQNLLLHCVGPVSSGSRCQTSAEIEWTRYWYNEDDDSRHRFDALQVVSNTARIESAPELLGDVDTGSIAFKNVILDFLRASLPFNRLISTSIEPNPNTSVGQFVKVFDGGETGIEIPGLLSNSHLMKSRCPVTVNVRLREAVMRCDLVFTRVANRTFPDITSFVEIQARLHIAAWITITASISDCVMSQSWRLDDDPLREQVLTIDEDGHSVVPDIDTIVYRDSQSRVVRPGPLIEWRGFLGGHSNPTARDQRWTVQALSPIPICAQMAANLSALRIPGWPVVVDSSPENPNQLYAGSVVVGALPA